ncbi:MAG: diaminopimelate decarboxylase [bacterium]|nr:diaminopimelate decarboxylase [bacterium]
MMLNDAFHYRTDSLYADSVRVNSILQSVGTPVYIYSLKRILTNYYTIRDAFFGAGIHAHVHYSAKANANLAILRTLIAAGAQIDAVSGGEIYRALQAGASPKSLVFAGVGKTVSELRYAMEQGVGWINGENIEEFSLIDHLAGTLGIRQQVSLRLNPNIAAKTLPHIATGHGGAKFGLSADAISRILSRAADYPHLIFDGIHVHIGSQLHDVTETVQAVQLARDLAAEFPIIQTLDIGGGIPVAYSPGETLPDVRDFAEALAPVVAGYQVLLEPGRRIVADAGILVTEVQYIKHQGDESFVIVDAGMTELIRPMLYNAHHEVTPVERKPGSILHAQLVGPVCESTDVFAQRIALQGVERGDALALLTAGAYGMVMASNYNARPRPPEVVIHPNGETWSVARRRETWADLTALEE